jgi:hypothetical protein
MKSNAHLYLPWSAVIELVYLPRVQLHQSVVPMASAELDGGCVLYRLARPDFSNRADLITTTRETA